MLLHFCPQCGSKLQAGFKFCPSCGEKLPSAVQLVAASSELTVTDGSPGASPGLQTAPPSVRDMGASPGLKTAPPSVGDIGGAEGPAPCSALTRSPLRSPAPCSALIGSPLRVTRSRTAPKALISPATPPHPAAQSDQQALASPRKRRGSPQVKQLEGEHKTEPVPSPAPSPRTPPSAKGSAKKARRVCRVEPLQEGEELSDQSGRQWKLEKLLSHREAELTYGVSQVGPGSSSTEYKHILRLGAKDGQMFNEQNFLQRAAKPAAVEKWIKRMKMDFLGIPSCVGFGLHEPYRFLIFPHMGQTLQSIIDEGAGLLSETAVLQLACRILDVLEFVHESEYVHADLHADNVLISPHTHTQAFLSGFGRAFRFCPGGKHVEYREGSRTLHHGNAAFISLDTHREAAPSRRSDLQSLGYCLLSWLTGALPWTHVTLSSSAIRTEKERYMTDVPGLVSHCFGQRKVSGAVQVFLSQVCALQYSEGPDYGLLKAGLSEALQQMGGALDKPLDLQVRKGRRQVETAGC